MLFARCPDGKVRLLLVHDARAGAWNLPGGLVDAGERPWDAMLREYGEEVGFPLDPALLRGDDAWFRNNGMPGVVRLPWSSRGRYGPFRSCDFGGHTRIYVAHLADGALFEGLCERPETAVARSLHRETDARFWVNVDTLLEHGRPAFSRLFPAHPMRFDSVLRLLHVLKGRMGVAQARSPSPAPPAPAWLLAPAAPRRPSPGRRRRRSPSPLG